MPPASINAHCLFILDRRMMSLSLMQVFHLADGRQQAVLRGAHFESINCCVWNPAQQVHVLCTGKSSRLSALRRHMMGNQRIAGAEMGV